MVTQGWSADLYQRHCDEKQIREKERLTVDSRLYSVPSAEVEVYEFAKGRSLSSRRDEGEEGGGGGGAKDDTD
ncbi:hypothetical protein RB195_021629 [Necator americanus]|uniref:Uncharacterized protein n=1 Tax=Necator americanus TaxID=51031 RepID=A0ABR1EC19_NECAM